MSRQDCFSWFATQFPLPRRHQRRLKSSSRVSRCGFALNRRLRLEPLEDRRMLAVITVTSLNDNILLDGEVTLREAIEAANLNVAVGDAPAGSVGVDAIDFDAFLSGQSILIGSELEITEQLVIDAAALTENVTIDAQHLSRIFNITAPSGDFTLAGLTLTGGETIGNNSFPATTFSGGAVRSVTSGSLTFEQSTILGNNTLGINAHGGGIFAYGDVTVSSSTISGNETLGDSAGGGGVLAYGNIVLLRSTVSGNRTMSADAHGGGINANGYAALYDSTVSGNSTLNDNAPGGGVFANGDVTLTGSTVSGNTTMGDYAGGGGIFTNGAVTLSSSTLTDNHTTGHSSSSGGGIKNYFSPITISDSIVAGNTSNSGSPDIEPGVGSLTANYSLLGTLVTPTAGNMGLQFEDFPLLGALANNGGPTQTHSLLFGSLAIDMGDPGFGAPTLSDQRGLPFERLIGNVDIGAYESQTVLGLNLIVDTIVDENDGDYSLGDLSLREAVGLANGSVGFETIFFDPALTGNTITLSGAELEITEGVTIDATALAQNVVINANGVSRIFNLTATNDHFTLAGLTLTGGVTTGSNAILDFDGPFSGGAVRSVTTGILTINQSTISGNGTMGDFAVGGGVFAYGYLMLTDSTVSGNNTLGTGSLGGGIFAYNSASLTNSTLSGNSVGNANGGGIFTFGITTLVDSTVSGNSAENGGGILSGEVTLVGSTISGNQAVASGAFGGGIHASGTVNLSNSTVTDNHATGAFTLGGGIWNDAGPITITNSIVAGNTSSTTSSDIFPGTGTFAVNFSLLGTAVTPDPGGVSNIFNNTPVLGPLANNWGPTQTHALLAGSPAIDAGDPSIVFNANEFDQRGTPFVRVFDDPVAAGAGIDIGAFELQPNPPIADFDGDKDVDGTDFLAWQRGFGKSNAVKSDGDADNDADVDSVDLDFWRVQYGKPVPLVAALSGPLSVSIGQTDIITPAQVAAQVVALAGWQVAAWPSDDIDSPAFDTRLATPSSTARQQAFAQLTAPLPQYPTSVAGNDGITSRSFSPDEKSSDLSALETETLFAEFEAEEGLVANFDGEYSSP